MRQNKRKYISVYFDDIPLEGRKKRDVTLAISPTEALYEKCKDFGSSEVKEAIGVYSYKDLVDKAQAEQRTINNYIKYKLKEKLR